MSSLTDPQFAVGVEDGGARIGRGAHRNLTVDVDRTEPLLALDDDAVPETVGDVDLCRGSGRSGGHGSDGVFSGSESGSRNGNGSNGIFSGSGSGIGNGSDGVFSGSGNGNGSDGVFSGSGNGNGSDGVLLTVPVTRFLLLSKNKQYIDIFTKKRVP